MKLSSYQKRKRDILYLEQCIRELTQRAEFFQRAIWEARKLIGEGLGVELFCELRSDEGGVVISDKEGLLKVIKELPLLWQHPGLEGDDYLTPYNSDF